MVVKLFLLGRPGSGKSTVARYITKLAQQEGWIPTSYCDYNVLYSMFQKELHKPSCPQQHFEPVDHNGFRVIDFLVLDPALKIIQKRAIASLNDCNPYTQKLIVIEFARDDYIQALGQFDPAFLQDVSSTRYIRQCSFSFPRRRCRYMYSENTRSSRSS